MRRGVTNLPRSVPTLIALSLLQPQPILIEQVVFQTVNSQLLTLCVQLGEELLRVVPAEGALLVYSHWPISLKYDPCCCET